MNSGYCIPIVDRCSVYGIYVVCNYFSLKFSLKLFFYSCYGLPFSVGCSVQHHNGKKQYIRHITEEESYVQCHLNNLCLSVCLNFLLASVVRLGLFQ